MCQVSAVASTGGPKRAPTFYTENDTRGATGLPLSAESVLGGDQKNPAKEAPPVTLGETEGHGWVNVEMSAAGKGGGGKGVRFSDTVQLYSYARTDPEWNVLRTAPIDQISWDDQDEEEVMHLTPSTDSVDEAVGPVFPTQPQSEQQPFGDGNMTGQSSSLAGQAQNASVEGEWRASTDGFQPPQRPCNSVPVVSTVGTWKRRHPHLSIDVPQRTLPHLTHFTHCVTRTHAHTALLATAPLESMRHVTRRRNITRTIDLAFFKPKAMGDTIFPADIRGHSFSVRRR